ncbi:MAG: 2-oxoacid:acceptor oxidoreductase family protein, partial [Pseudomonadota bacterium]
MNPEKDSYNLIITGVGGQGNVLSSQLIGQAFVHKGYFTTIGETYGASQRGGSVMSHIRISSKKQLSPLIPKGKADVIVALEPVEAL